MRTYNPAVVVTTVIELERVVRRMGCILKEER